MNWIIRILTALSCIIPAVAYPDIRKVMDGYNQFGGGKAYSGFTAGDAVTFIPFILIVTCSVWPTTIFMWITLFILIPYFLLAFFVSATMPLLGFPFLFPMLLFFVHFGMWLNQKKRIA